MSIDQLTGRVNHRYYVDGGVFGPWGKLRLEDIGLEMSHVYERNYSVHPDDPNSARASMTQTYEMERGSWRIRIECGADMTSTPATFELDAWVEAYESEKSVCRREWKSSLPRKHL